MSMRSAFATSLCLLGMFASNSLDRVLLAEFNEAKKVQFNRDVRPILSDNCFYCHGPDNKTRQADLRLDNEEGLKGEKLLVPGSPEKSELYLRLLATDPEQRMPPAESHKQLTPAQIQTIKQWIEQGAEYQLHWSFMPLQMPELSGPSLANDSAVVDHLINAELSKQQLEPTAIADRTTLLRRLHFDLVGLPPSPQEVAEFLQDKSADAYSKQVERLLASPHFGERMAMWWLDLVRYADTVGYHGDQDMSVWPFRDYVIDAFNNNKPFDQFTLEQLAGDLLPDASKQLKIASGYNRLGMMSAEGGVQDKEYLAKYIAERVRNVSGTWLGITMGCCECHNHKFDPLASREFYQMEAFFADIKERGLYSGSDSSGKWGSFMQVPSPEQEKQMADLSAALNAAETKYKQPTNELAAAQSGWEALQLQWKPLIPATVQSKNGATLTIEPDGSIKASGKSPDNESYSLSFAELPADVTAFRLEVMPDDSLPSKGPGRAGNGNFVLSEFVAEIADKPAPAAKTEAVPQSDPAATSPNTSPDKPKASTPENAPAEPAKPANVRALKFDSAAASYEQTGAAGGNPYGRWAVAAAIDQDAKGAKWGWAVMEQVGRKQFAVFHLAPDQDQTIKADQQLVITLQQNLDNPQHTLGRFRLWYTTNKLASASEAVSPAEIGDILELAADKRSAEQAAKLADHYRSIAPQLQPLRDEIAAIKKKKNELDAKIPITLITETVPPRTVRVLPRGNWMDESGEVVEPGFPVAIQTVSFSKPSDRRMTRHDLAKWIVARDNPLTARVLVNRLWKIYFGAGLARKLDDLGAQGEPPSHPEVLDYLAIKFIDSGWDVKQLIRTIFNTQAYQRSSLASEKSYTVDPQNRWLSRQGRFRLDAELVRDNALAVSGLLVKQVGGRSVKPYQPPGYWAYLNFPTREWANGTGDELYRRGLYTHWQRQYLHPSLMAFDAPNREECTADRPRSNTPLQSLALLNDPSYVEAARAFAARLLSDSNAKDDRERLKSAFRLAVSRDPSDAEVQVILELLQRAKQEYSNNPDNAKQLLSVGAFPSIDTVKPEDLAAWTAVTRAILNLHEVMTRN